MVEQDTFPDRLPTGKHYYKEITIILQHHSLQVIQEREREIYHVIVYQSIGSIPDAFKPGIERYTSVGDEHEEGERMREVMILEEEMAKLLRVQTLRQAMKDSARGMN